MSSPVILIPGAPVLVPELSGAAAAESAPRIEQMAGLLRDASQGASRVLVLGADPRRRRVHDVRASLRRWGADVPVGRDGDPQAGPDAVPDAALIAWWALDGIGCTLPRTFRGVDAGECSPPRAQEGELVVVVADGPASLTPRAPVPEHPRGLALDAALRDWLSAGRLLPDPGPDVAAEVGWWSRPAWLALAALVEGRPASEAASWAPFGVGYHLARWDR